MKSLLILMITLVTSVSYSAGIKNHMFSFEGNATSRSLVVTRLLDEDSIKYKSSIAPGLNLEYRFRMVSFAYLLLTGGIQLPEFKAEDESVAFDESLTNYEAGVWLISGLKSQVSLTYKLLDDLYGEEVGGSYGLFKEQVGVGKIKLTQYFAGRKELGFGINLAAELGKGKRITSRSYFELSLFTGTFSRSSSFHFELGGFSNTKKVQDTTLTDSYETADTGVFAKLRYGFGF